MERGTILLLQLCMQLSARKYRNKVMADLTCCELFVETPSLPLSLGPKKKSSSKCVFVGVSMTVESTLVTLIPRSRRHPAFCGS